MKSLPILFTACFLVASVPLAGAADSDCSHIIPQEQTLVHPRDSERFFKVDLEAPEKIGEWMNTNGRAGLQTEDCGSGPGLVYEKDSHSAILP